LIHQFAICRLRPDVGRGRQISVVVLQHDQLSSSRTRIVAPLLTPNEVRKVERLHPTVQFRGEELLLVIDQLSAVDVARLGPPEGSLERQRHEIVSALDLLFTGY